MKDKDINWCEAKNSVWRDDDTLFERVVSIYTKKGDTIFDPWCGSGEILLAAVKSGRNAVGAERREGLFEKAAAMVDGLVAEGAESSYAVFDGDAAKALGDENIKDKKIDFVFSEVPEDAVAEEVEAALRAVGERMEPGAKCALIVKDCREGGEYRDRRGEIVAAGKKAGLALFDAIVLDGTERGAVTLEIPAELKTSINHRFLIVFKKA